MDLLFNKKGVPLVGFGRQMFVSTTGAPTAAIAKERGTLPVDTRQDLSIAIENLKISLGALITTSLPGPMPSLAKLGFLTPVFASSGTLFSDREYSPAG
jgi:hypothetical protein